MHGVLNSYKDSLQFTQHEVDLLKEENVYLKDRIEEIELEEKKNGYQVKKNDERLERQDTIARCKNLVVKGFPEKRENGEEGKDLRSWIYEMLDELKVRKDIGYDTAHRVGQFMNKRACPVLIIFNKIADHDEVYMKMTHLKKSQEFSRVWINEHLGPSTRRTVNLIRLVARQAQTQGVQHKATKFSIKIGQNKYNENNLRELPAPLTLASVKTVKIDENRLAYQSEHSIYSNLYPAEFKIGKPKYTSSEQAYHHIRAVKHRKPLAASRILMSRHPYDIMRIGAEFNSSKEWEDCEDNIMYGCILRKFEQNPDLPKQLIATDTMELVEV